MIDGDKTKKANVKWKDNQPSEKTRFILKPRESNIKEFTYSEEDFLALADLVTQISGIELKINKKEMLYARLAKRLRKLGFSSFKEYLYYLNTENGIAEIASLTNAMTTNLTRFFREPYHFEHFEKEFLNKHLNLFKSGERTRIRIWSAGCSSGEEAYSLAFVLDRFLKTNKLEHLDAKILATDIDTFMLEAGRKGIYAENSIADIPPAFKNELSEMQEGQHRINPSMRKYISFKSLNLIDHWPFKGPFDGIFCRNVMIYFDADTKDKLLGKFIKKLDREGFFYIGHSETINKDFPGLELTSKTAYRKSGAV